MVERMELCAGTEAADGIIFKRSDCGCLRVVNM